MFTFTVGDKYDPVGCCGEMWDVCVISPVPALVSRACVGSTGFQELVTVCDLNGVTTYQYNR